MIVPERFDETSRYAKTTERNADKIMVPETRALSIGQDNGDEIIELQKINKSFQ